MKKMLAWVLVAATMFAVYGCTAGQKTSQPSAEAPAKTISGATAAPAADIPVVKEDKDITIAVVPKALDNAIFLDAKNAAEEKGKELGIKIEWVGPTKSDAAEQVSVVEGLIERKVDGILISCNDADALKDVIDRAVDSGIYVGIFDSDSPNSKRAFYAGTDNYAIGKLAAEKVKELIPDGGKVAILTGVLGAPNLEERIRGFKETVKGSNIEVLPVQTGEDDVQKSVEIVSQYTAANPDLAAWFFDGGWPYFADPDALPEVKKFMKNGGHIVSIDTCEPMMQFVGMGMVDLLIGQNYPAMGSIGVETLYKLIKGDKSVDLGDATHYIDTGYELADINNWKEVLATKTPW
ncbi:MAG TPA: sugar ABC transporter substrate-binding protein [Ruminiclostridium sp.]|nr:sugar ABC transporter substrate-binding protein [Ruminiclostridium sp.]